MELDLIFNNGNLVDKETGNIYKGVAPRDLSVGDTFQSLNNGSVITEKITGITVDKDTGILMISAQEAI